MINNSEVSEQTEVTRPRGAGIVTRLAAVLAVLALYYLIQYLADVLALHPHLGLPTTWWVRAFDHHLQQAVWALVGIGVLSRGRWRDWGLNIRNRDESIRIIRKFLLYYGVYFVGIGFIIQLLLFPAPVLTEPATPGNIAGRLAFGFLFVGVSEEILFRGLFHTFLARYWPGVLHSRDIAMPVAGAVAALVFTIAHVGFSASPFAITHFYASQLLMAFTLGLFYSWAYHRTGSLLAPIVAHNLSDGLLWVSEYVLASMKTGPAVFG